MLISRKVGKLILPRPLSPMANIALVRSTLSLFGQSLTDHSNASERVA